MSHPNFTVHIRETWKGSGAQRPSFIAKPHHNLRRLFEVYMLKKAGPPLESLICVYKDKTIPTTQYEQPLLELGFVDGDEIIVYKVHFCFSEKDSDIAIPPTSYQTDFRYMYNTKIFSDIIFIIEGQKVTAHKCVLAARCEKFRAMLQNAFKESQQTEITLECKLAPFQAMLEYIYTDNIPSDCDLLFDVLALAEEYLLLQLKSICEVKLLENLDLYNAANLLVHADLYRCDTLKKYCMQFILMSYELLVNIPQFDDLQKAPHLLMEIIRAISKGAQDTKRQKYTS